MEVYMQEQVGQGGWKVNLHMVWCGVVVVVKWGCSVKGLVLSVGVEVLWMRDERLAS